MAFSYRSTFFLPAGLAINKTISLPSHSVIVLKIRNFNQYYFSRIWKMSRQQALFSSGGGNRSSNASKALVEFRAGKMSMSGTLVSPDKRKGMVMVEQGIQYKFIW